MTSRDEAWLRRKRYLGLDHPDAGRDGYEKWPRFTAEVPTELAEEIDRVQKKSLGVNYSSASRAGAVRAALRLWLNFIDPPPEPRETVDSTAVDITDLPVLLEENPDAEITNT